MKRLVIAAVAVVATIVPVAAVVVSAATPVDDQPVHSAAIDWD